MNTVTKVLGLLQLAMRSNEKDKILLLLSKLPLEDMEDIESNKILIFCLNAAYAGNAIQAAAIILNEFNKLIPDDATSLPLLVRLFGMIDLSDDVLKFLIFNLKSATYTIAMQDLIYNDANEEFLFTYNRIDLLFGNQSNETYKELYTLALNQENTVAIDYFKMKVAVTNDYAPIPKWVYNFKDIEINESEENEEYKYDVDKLPTHNNLIAQIGEIKSIEYKLPSLDKAINLLTSGLSDLGISDDDVKTAKDKITENYTSSDESKKMELLQPILENMSIYNLKDDLKLFRILGPVNPHYDSDFAANNNHICYRYGGCRMLTCTCFCITEDDEPIDDWFTGFCQTCALKIRNRAHAIRKPMPMGGFSGCFHSVKCMKETLISPDILANLMIDRIHNQMLQYKIQDRNEAIIIEESEINDFGVIYPAEEQIY
jgi:hypothetical protein